MSQNRLKFDTCAYKKTLDQSVGPLSYQLNPMKYENCNKCRHELGLVGGTAVSHIRGNLVDLESDLMGTTRSTSLCPTKKYQPGCDNVVGDECQPKKISIGSSSCGKPRSLDTSLLHLPPCQMLRYKPVPLPPSMNLQQCPAPVVGGQPATCQPQPQGGYF
jgi:hypothetical protein